MPRDSSWNTAVVRPDFSSAYVVASSIGSVPMSSVCAAWRSALGVDDGHRAVDDRQRAQPEEVELHQPGGFDVILVELRDHAAAGGVASTAA